MLKSKLGDLSPLAGEILTGVITNQVEPQLSYMWEVRIETPPRVYGYERNLQLFARNCTIPQRSVEEINRSYAGGEVSHAGFATDPKQFRATFWDDKRLVGYRYFSEWMNQQSDPQFGRQANLLHSRRTIKVRLKDRSDVFLGLELVFTDAYITTLAEIALNYEESSPLMFDATMKYEKLIVNGVDYSLNGSNAGQVDLIGIANSILSNAVSSVTSRVNRAKDTLLDRFRE